MGDNGHLIVADNGKFSAIASRPRGSNSSAEARQEYGTRHKNFLAPSATIKRIEACKGGKPAGSNFDWAGPLTEVVSSATSSPSRTARRMTMKKPLGRPQMRSPTATTPTIFANRISQGWICRIAIEFPFDP